MLTRPEVLCDIPVEGPQLCGLTFFRGLLWYSDSILNKIIAIDPLSGTVERTFDCPGVRTGLTSRHGNLLQVAGPERSLREIDPDTGQTVKEFDNPRPGHELCGMEATDDSLWLGYKEPSVVDLRRWRDLSPVTSIETDADVGGVTVIDALLAVADHPQAHINIFNPSTKEILVTFAVAGNPTGLTWDGQRLWYCDNTNSELRALEMPADVLLT